MARISIFAKRPFYSKTHKYLFRGSSVIRGEQIAAYTGARLNPKKDYENDICIYIKPRPQWINSSLKHIYIDLIDGSGLIGFISKNPKISVIACSQADYEYLTRKLKLKNKVVFIPQHHCNFERVVRNRDQVTMAGVIGVPGLMSGLPEGLEERLTQEGLKFLKYSDFKTRQDVVDFYKKIDIQVVWRPWERALGNPLKIINASSFGIPTIAYQEPAFTEVDGCYIPVKNLDEFIKKATLLKSSPHLYATYQKQCLDKAEAYHIERIAQMYRQLE